MSRAAANKKNSSKTKSTNPEVYFEAFFFPPRASTGSHLKFQHFFFFGTLCLCKWPDVEVITLSASVEKVSLFTLFVLLFAWIRCKRPGSDKPLLRLKQMQPWDCSFVPVCIQNGSYFSFTLQRFYRCVAECIEIFFFLPGITHLVFFVKERKLLTILFAKAEV